MEDNKDVIGEDAGTLGNLLPPRLEDAGLEDCALPPDAIHEAFLKAADAVRSRAASIFHSDDDSVDALIGIDPYDRPCSGRVPEVVGDKVADRIELEEEGGKSCVDGLRGLEIGEKKHDEEKAKVVCESLKS